MRLSETDLQSELGVPPFKPLPFLDSGMKQTIAAAYWPVKARALPTKRVDISLEDGDVLRTLEMRSVHWRTGDRIVMALHGLTGSSQSRYMVRLAQRLFREDVLVVNVNLRGCGEGFGLARNPYHSGRSEDIRSVLRDLAIRYPGSPVTVVSFSLGANIALKLAGEDGETPTGYMDSVIAVCPPADLAKSANSLRQKNNILFDKFFALQLRADIQKLHKKFPDLDKAPDIPLKINLIDIDELYTAPRCGFKNAQDYYEKSSSAPLIPKIRIPGLILCSEDDPCVDSTAFDQIEIPDNVDFIRTRQGGHVAFLGSTDEKFDVQWMDQVLLKWMKKRLSL